MKLNDPHVETLTYAVQTDELISYRDDALLEEDTDQFHIRITGNQAVLTLKEHFPSEEVAIGAVSPYLTAWQIDAALRIGPGVFRLDYRGAHVIDRRPENTHVIEVAARCAAKFSGSARASITMATYPEPPKGFLADHIVEAMWHKYERAVKKQESVSSAAYYCLTAITSDFTGRKSAGRAMKICCKVLDELGRLSSDIGDDKTGRKYLPSQSIKARAHSEIELNWLLAVMNQLIRRAGEHAADPAGSFPMITMSSLPSLQGQTSNGIGT